MRAFAITLTAIGILIWTMGQGYALRLANSSITISTAKASVSADHLFGMTVQSTAPVGSIVFEYCSNSPLFDVACQPPAGLSLTNAVLNAQTGNTNFVINTFDSTPNRLVISRPAAAGIAAPSTYSLSNVINPSTSDQTTYVRISTHPDVQGADDEIDRGAVAFATTSEFEVGAFVPPTLNLCVGITVATDCSQSSGDRLDLGTLTSQNTRTGTSQLSAATNYSTGYALYVIGSTMTSGNNEIMAVSNQPSRPGTAQFGINLRKNTNPSTGSDADGSGTAIPAAMYNSPNVFSLASGSLFASANSSTNYSRMTVSYIANIPSNQPAGTYSTTLTYLAAAEF